MFLRLHQQHPQTDMVPKQNFIGPFKLFSLLGMVVKF
jgi:hypothetical protein